MGSWKKTLWLGRLDFLIVGIVCAKVGYIVYEVEVWDWGKKERKRVLELVD